MLVKEEQYKRSFKNKKLIKLVYVIIICSIGITIVPYKNVNAVEAKSEIKIEQAEINSTKENDDKEEIMKKMRKKYGLDEPATEQHNMYEKNLFNGDFGTSINFEGELADDIIKGSFLKLFPLELRVLMLITITCI